MKSVSIQVGNVMTPNLLLNISRLSFPICLEKLYLNHRNIGGIYNAMKSFIIYVDITSAIKKIPSFITHSPAYLRVLCLAGLISRNLDHTQNTDSPLANVCLCKYNLTTLHVEKVQLTEQWKLNTEFRHSKQGLCSQGTYIRVENTLINSHINSSLIAQGSSWYSKKEWK